LKAPPPDDVANDDTRLRAWLVCVARRCEVKQTRADRSPAPLSGTEVARDSAERDERTNLLSAALDVLAGKSAAAAHLLERHYLDELPVGELAKEMNLAPRVVSMRLSRAKKKLRAILEEMGGGVATLERIRKKFGIARGILPRRATTWCPRPFNNRRFTMKRIGRNYLKCFLALVLFVMLVGASVAADITPDMTPLPGPGKITSTGKWSVGGTETPSSVNIIATPSGGGTGGYSRKSVPIAANMDTYTITADNLAAKTEYDVTVYLEYDDGGRKAVFTKVYKVKTQ
jgi:hypothetical protein